MLMSDLDEKRDNRVALQRDLMRSPLGEHLKEPLPRIPT